MGNRRYSPESIEKMRAAKLGSKNPMWGKKHSPKTIMKMRESKLGHKNPNWKGDEATESTIRNRLIKDLAVSEGYERHHIDGNVRNSDSSNILILTRKQHMIKDGRMEALIKRNKEMIGPKHPRWKGVAASDGEITGGW